MPTAAVPRLDSLLRAELNESGRASLRLRGTEISGRTNPPEPMQVDGEPLPESVGAFRATVRPRSLTVLV